MRNSIKGVLISIVLCMAVIMGIGSCISMQEEGPPTTPAETFLTARMVFNGLLSDYVDQKVLADADTKARWTKDIDPWFERGAIALNAWGSTLKAGESPQATRQAYFDVKNQLMAIILRELTATH